MLCAKNATDPKLAESRRTFLAIDEGGATHRAFEDEPAACHGDNAPFIGLKSAHQHTTKKFTELLSPFFPMSNKPRSDPRGVSARHNLIPISARI